MGKEKLMAAQAAYKSAGSDPQSMAGMAASQAGFEMKSGSKGKSSGASLPLSGGPAVAYSQEPSAEGAGDNDEDLGEIVEPDESA